MTDTIEITPEFISRIALKLVEAKSKKKGLENQLKEIYGKNGDWNEIQQNIKLAKIDKEKAEIAIVKNTNNEKLVENIDEAKEEVKDLQNSFSDYLGQYAVSHSTNVIEVNGENITIVIKSTVKPEQMMLFSQKFIS